jgi:lambda family phage tail tape measure protein
MNDDLARKFFYLQAAAAQAFATIGDYLEPIFGKTQNANEEFERAQNLIKAIGLALAAYVGVKTVTTILDLVNAFKLFNKESKIQVGISAALQALQGPKGWAVLAGSVAAAGAAIYGLNKLMDEYTDKVDAARQAREALEGGKTDKPFDPNAQQFDKNKLKQREAAVNAQKEQNALLEKQNAEANKYQEIINSTIGMMDGLAARTKLNAEIEKETADKKAEVQSKINLELKKGKDVNMGVVDELRKQLDIIDKQGKARKDLGLQEIESLETQRMNTAEMQKQLGLIDLQTQKDNASKEAELRRKVIRGEMTDQQMADELALSKIESARYNKVSKLEEQLKVEKNEARQKELRDSIDLANATARAETEAYKQGTKDKTDLQSSFIAGTVKSMEELSKQFDPYKMGQDAIMMGWKRISDAVDTFVETGKFKFSDFARSVIADYAKMIAKAQIFQALNAVMGFFGLPTVPGKAAGGSVSSNQPYIVGEKGPELFVPKSAGDIIPNKDMAKPSMAMSSDKGPTNAPITNNYNNYNINALDAKSVAQLFAENRKAIFGANKMAEREMSYAGVR